MQITGLLTLAAAAATSIVSSPSMDRTGEWWIRFSAPVIELSEGASESVAKIPLNLEAFPGSSLILCSTKSVADLGEARRAEVSDALATAGVPRAQIHDAGDCGFEGDSRSFDNAESVLIIMQRVG
ncbi:hypothetical protein [Altererythrobacter sp. Root672]|uniref:hypothetical protein n=1 Tax=Altererythrobacter sp. Root672 TaxID=1736584 RepID=UPI0006F664A7|nr:hypothetical protein [Altererythrobacter sp. Root672]KRA83291.1 hypothetical protein ASD76_04325 [Altererythrobacter sp. Root672]